MLQRRKERRKPFCEVSVIGYRHRQTSAELANIKFNSNPLFGSKFVTRGQVLRSLRTRQHAVDVQSISFI
jgi:hypothetical protein